MEDIKLKDKSPFELLMCPYCGARLNRVKAIYQKMQKMLLPTSCPICHHERFGPLVKQVAEVEEPKGDKDV